MKRKLCISLIYILAILSVIFASLSLYGLFSMWSIPAHPNNTTANYLLYPSIAALKYVFLALCATSLTAFFILFHSFTKKGIMEKGIFTIIKEKSTALNVFVIISCVISAMSVIFVVSHKEIIWDYFLPRRESPFYDAFMDFFNHITYVREPSTVYFDMTHACFPPLAYIFYYALSVFLPSDATVVHNAWQTQYYAQIVYIVYVILCVVAFFLLARAVTKKLSIGKTASLIFFVLVSNVFVFEVLERGNSVLIVTLLLLAAVYLMDSPKTYMREFALLCIAIAVGFKIYPAIFGILYLREKRFKEAIRLTVYGVALSVLPFAFFGGFSGMMQFFANQTAVQSYEYADFYSVRSAVRYLSDIFNNGNILAWDKVGSVLQIVFILVNLVAILNKKLRPWERVMLLCSIMAFGPSWSGGYTSIFFAIPMLMFFADSENYENNRVTKSKSNKIYTTVVAVSFAFLFSFNMFVFPNGAIAQDFTCLPMYLINSMIVVRAIYYFIPRMKSQEKSV